MEAKESKVVPTTNACEEFLGREDLTMEELKAAYRELDDTCASVGDEYQQLSDAFNECEQECASLRAELASTKEKYSLYDYYQKKVVTLENQVFTLKQVISGLVKFIQSN